VIEVRHETPERAPVVLIELKHDSPRDLGRLLTAAIGTGEVDLVVDLGSRRDASSELLIVLHRVARQVRRLGGTLRVVASEPSLHRLFELTLISRTLPIFATRDEALTARSA
jgi:anti-anti-sigma factor